MANAKQSLHAVRASMAFVAQMPLVRGYTPKTPVAPTAVEVKGKMNGLRPPLTSTAVGAYLLVKAVKPKCGLTALS